MIFKTTDPLDRSIILKKSTWEEKIINLNGNNDDNSHGNSHVEMKDKLDWVKNCVEKPIYILNDIGLKLGTNGDEIQYINSDRQEYYTFKFDEAETLNAIKTVVDFSKDPNVGEIVTTHVMSGPVKRIKAKGGVVYDSTGKEA